MLCAPIFDDRGSQIKIDQIKYIVRFSIFWAVEWAGWIDMMDGRMG